MLVHIPYARHFASWLAVLLIAVPGTATEVARLSKATWTEFVPQGKEADRIYGDWVLRNDLVTCVIAEPLATRNANMTVRNVGWAIIDLTQRGTPNDQLSAFYPGSTRHVFHTPANIRVTVDGVEMIPDEEVQLQGKVISLSCAADSAGGLPQATVKYTLTDGSPFVQVETTYTNGTQQVLSFDLTDTIRADKSFQFGTACEGRLFWADDEWFRQTYGILCDEDYQVQRSGNRGVVVAYQRNGAAAEQLAPQASLTLTRKVFPAANALQALGIAERLRKKPQHQMELTIRDPRGPVRAARVELLRAGQSLGAARTPGDGKLSFAAAPGNYQLKVQGLGRPEATLDLNVTADCQQVVSLEPCGYVLGRITSADGGPIPCKVAFRGLGETPNPYFGPDTAVTVENLKYSHNGRFRQEIGPGKYEVVISYGTEYDAVRREIEVRANEDTTVAAQLVRTVDTRGWVSADFHSHSSPSGDNTCSQRARVLNLLCEHIEFAPCTEHNRVDTYVPHLRALQVEKLMATCSGMELTGQPLPINHQNAFPLKLVPRTQDNGGPVTDENPVVQIERLAMWNNNSEKLVQGNHPNLVQMLGDRDLDGKADGGFAGMLNFMHVVEIHPIQTITLVPGTPAFQEAPRNPVFHWMQMINLNCWTPGVVNTDAHYSFHESGWQRNYIRSATDDPAEIDTMEMVRASAAGHVVMTNGPFLEVSLRGSGEKSAGPGDTLAVPSGQAKLHVKVQCPNWFDINRVQVYVNGRPLESANFTRRNQADRFGDGVVKFEQQIPLTLEQDAHVIVAAVGEGLKMGPIMGPRFGENMPAAVSNPIFVDVDGGGFKPNGDLLDVPLPLEKTVDLPKR